MKKFLSVLLAVLMLLPILAACSKEPALKISLGKKKIDLSGYSVVFGAELTEAGREQANASVEKLSAASSLALQIVPDVQTEPVETKDKEILIGKTNRAETSKTLEELGSAGWAVRVFKNKIVIVGTTPFLTRTALTYFEENYLGNATGGTITLNKKAEYAQMPITVMNADCANQYTVLYSDWVDDKPDKPTTYQRTPTSVGGTDVDYVYDLSKKVQAYLSDQTSVKLRDVLIADDDDGEEKPLEIWVGKLNRPAYMEQLYRLDVDEYALYIENGKIMLLGWNEDALEFAYEEFCDLVDSSKLTDGSADCHLPTQGYVRGTYDRSAFAIDFPKPEATLHGAFDVGDNQMEYVYHEGATLECYQNYCNQLRAAGYTALSNEYAAEGNAFNTFVHHEKGITLHTYYSAYDHADKAAMNDSLAGIRVISAYTSSGASLPDASILSPQSYEKVCESAITAPKMQGEGMSYIITLEDGSFVVLDGGLAKEKDLLWDTLVKLHTDIHGAPSAENRIHVRAWFFSHEHSDHVAAFIYLVNENPDLALLKLDYLLLNTGGYWETYNSENANGYLRAKIADFQKKITGGFTYLKPHTGQIFYFANLKMEIMTTHEDHYPTKAEWYNNMTTIIRTTLTSTGEGGSKDSTCLWLGDSEALNGRRLIGLWGESIRSEMVQLAHHGSLGVEQAVYDIAKPEIIWYPGLAGRWIKPDGDYTKSLWYYQLDQYVAWKMTGVKKVIFYSKLHGATMTLTKNGYDPTVRNTETGEALRFKTSAEIITAGNHFYSYITREAP